MMMLTENLTKTTIEIWFIPFDIIMIISNILFILFSILFLLIIIFDKTCHTVPMMLIANSCLSALLFGCILLSMSIFTLENDFQQIQYQDSFCIFRTYFNYVSAALFHYSILLQAFYQYVTAVYPHHLYWQSVKIQLFAICITWIFSFAYPIAFIYTGDIAYNIDNQICQLPLRFSFPIIHTAPCVYIIPVSIIGFIYLKLFLYVHEISQHIIPANIIIRVERQLKMVRRIVILISILLTLGLPYASFAFMSFFTRPPKYHFRIGFIFVDISSAFVMIILFQFTDPLKASIMKIIKRRSNRIVPIIP